MLGGTRVDHFELPFRNRDEISLDGFGVGGGDLERDADSRGNQNREHA